MDRSRPSTSSLRTVATTSWGRRAKTEWGLALALALPFAAACGGKSRAGEAPIGMSHVAASGVETQRAEGAVDFAFDSLDARPVSSAAMRGKVSVLGFFTTYDLGSQAQVNYL